MTSPSTRVPRVPAPKPRGPGRPRPPGPPLPPLRAPPFPLSPTPRGSVQPLQVQSRRLSATEARAPPLPLGRERRTHRTQPMGGAAAPPREVRLTGPGGSGESGRLLTRASERGRLSRRVARGIRSALHSGHSWIPLPSAGLLVLPESLPCLPLSSICTPSREIPLSGLAVPRPRIPAPPASLLACYYPAPRNCPLPSHPPGTFILTPPCPV